MKYEDVMKQILSEADALAIGTGLLHRHLARTTPGAIERTVEARMRAMMAGNEPFRRMPSTEHRRVAAEIEREESTARRGAAGVARHAVEPRTWRLKRTYQTFIDQRRKDTALCFERALQGVDKGAWIALELLRETLRPQVERLTAAELYDTYRDAYQRKHDPRAYLECSLIESRVRRGGIVANEQDAGPARELREMLEAVEDLRTPLEVRDVPAIVAAAETAVAHADTAQVLPVDATHPANLGAKQAFEQAAAAFAAEAAGQ
jgi:hypothetical protein